MTPCKLCGFSEESETHKEPYGKQYAGVYYTHAFEPVPEQLVTHLFGVPLREPQPAIVEVPADPMQRIAERIWYDADDMPATPGELKALLTKAASKGYEMGLAVNA